MSICGRGAGHHTAASPAEPADHAPHRAHDRGRVQVCCHPLLSPGRYSREPADHKQNMQTTLPTVRMIVDVSKSVVILSSAQIDT